MVIITQHAGALFKVFHVLITKQNSLHFQYFQDKNKGFDVKSSQSQSNQVIKKHLCLAFSLMTCFVELFDLNLSSDKGRCIL